ncbi:PQQ-binding-like beta-propeller repeat protein [Microbulbifer elongatus]|uniref:outer membrane protein assembly factor BamB family protein n=1 Tax=Microbulbifer elongatus TaxID=86173 RepID=UPI001E28D773|nr:PQQ-binding-like beta-propeller repeat protein [Microbulbifer elongatus]
MLLPLIRRYRRSLTHVHSFYFWALLLAVSIPQSYAGEFEVSGSYLFVRDKGQPVEETINFGAPVAGSSYRLRVYNGAEDSHPVTSATVVLNGSELLFPNDFSRKVDFLEVPVSLQIQNTLIVQLGGKPGSGLVAEVIGIDSENPVITAAIDPAANTAGWHNSNATVTFSCSDAFSGIESCSDPVVVTEEGVSQSITGIAEDKATNRAETQVSVSIDKTAPQIDANIIPTANSAGWHRQAVSISYQCADTLSGVIECPKEVSVSEEGGSQIVAARATDIAGNTAEVQSSVNIDFTAPEITANLSSAANAAGWHNAPVTVSYKCSDDLSGIVRCPEDLTLSGDGEDLSATGTAEDLAGNLSRLEISYNLDQVAPELSFVSPVNGSLVREPQPQLKLLVSDNLALDPGSLEVLMAGSPVADCRISENFINCTLPESLPSNSEVMLTASIMDMAGNIGEASITTAIDTDGDSVADYIDQCAETSSGQPVNADGCSLAQLDSDNDGINDADEVAAGSDPEDPASFPPLSIASFVASPSAIESGGQRVELRWRVHGAQHIELSNDVGDGVTSILTSEGTLNVSPQVTTNYTLTARGPQGEVSRSLAVTLDLPPPPDLWSEPSIPVPDQIATSLAVASDGSAYVGAFDGNFYKVDPRGEIEWTLEGAGVVMGKAAISGERVIVGANISGSGSLGGNGRVYALAADKSLLWQVDTDGAVVAGPLLSDDHAIIYIATYSGNIYAFNSDNGEELWRFQLPGGQTITASPVLSGHKLIVHTEANQVFALDAVTPSAAERVLWNRNL